MSHWVKPGRLKGCTVTTRSGKAYRVMAVLETGDLLTERTGPIGLVKRLWWRLEALICGPTTGDDLVP